MAKYIKAESGSKNTVIYTDDHGKQWVHSGGTRTWRNNNPGNLVVGNISKDNNAIGKAGGFAVFPDYESGHAGLIDCLKRTYPNADLKFLVSKYAPKSDNNKVDAVVAVSTKGNQFLRAKPNSFIDDNLENLG